MAIICRGRNLEIIGHHHGTLRQGKRISCVDQLDSEENSRDDGSDAGSGSKDQSSNFARGAIAVLSILLYFLSVQLFRYGVYVRRDSPRAGWMYIVTGFVATGAVALGISFLIILSLPPLNLR